MRIFWIFHPSLTWQVIVIDNFFLCDKLHYCIAWFDGKHVVENVDTTAMTEMSFVKYDRSYHDERPRKFIY